MRARVCGAGRRRNQCVEKRTGRNYGRDYSQWAAFLNIQPDKPSIPSDGPMRPPPLVPVAAGR